jgi:hypothetical protein
VDRRPLIQQRQPVAAAPDKRLGGEAACGRPTVGAWHAWLSSVSAQHRTGELDAAGKHAARPVSSPAGVINHPRKQCHDSCTTVGGWFDHLPLGTGWGRWWSRVQHHWSSTGCTAGLGSKVDHQPHAAAAAGCWRCFCCTGNPARFGCGCGAGSECVCVIWPGPDSTCPNSHSTRYALSSRVCHASCKATGYSTAAEV